MKRSILKQFIGLAVIFIFVTLTAWYVVSNWSEFASLRITNAWLLLPASLLLLINVYAAGILIDLTMEPHGVSLSKNEAFGLASMTRFINQVAPTYIAATVRAAYMKRVHRISFTQFSSSFVISNLLQFFISGILSIVTFLLLFRAVDNAQPIIIVVIGSILFLGTLLVPPHIFIGIFERLLANSRSKWVTKAVNQIVTLLLAYDTVRSHPGLLPRTIVWMLVTTFAIGGVYYLLYQSLGFQIGLVEALFIATLSGWSILFAITPGSLGIREGLMVAAAGIAGVSIPATLLVAVLLRLLMLVVPGGISLFYLRMFIVKPKNS